ncbi:MAG: rod shape-determining protein MreC [Chloroflexi bacterium]|nr:rod shape-determining protein MreC [Chloroflexota bacterium]
MKQSPRRSWLPLVLLVLGLLLLVLHESGYLSPVENVLHYVLDPLQRAFSRAVAATGDLFQTVREVRVLRAQVEELQAEVDALTVENVRLREYESEAQQLRALLNFTSEHPVSAFIGADVVSQEACLTFPCGDVVGAEPNPYLHYVTINVGSQQGIKVGMPVVSRGAGLVGRIAQVAPRTAMVQLLTDADSAVAALLQTSRVTGLVEGQPDGTLRMEYIPQEEIVEVGDIVLTSGLGSELGGFVPKGLVVGQVTDVKQEDYELFQAAIVRPAVDFSQLEIVLVITAFDPIPADEPPLEEP